MTDAKDTVHVELWRRRDDGTGLYFANGDSTATIEGTPGWAGEVQAVAEGLVEDEFEGIAIVLDADPAQPAHSVLDVLTITYEVPEQPAPRRVIA